MVDVFVFDNFNIWKSRDYFRFEFKYSVGKYS